jgi:hypothetical protein
MRAECDRVRAVQHHGSDRRVRGELLRRNVEYNLEISDVFSDGYSYGSDARVGGGKLCLSITCHGAGYLQIRLAPEALEFEAAGLGAAFYWTLVRSLYRVMRIYDHEDAMMYEENLHAYADEDDSGEPYGFPEVKEALPPYIAATLDRGKRPGYRKLLCAHAQGPHGSWIGRLLTMERLSRLRVRSSRHLLEGNYDGPPLPSLILAFRDHDAIVACFDEESQHMLESTAEPTLCVDFSPHKPDEVDQAARAVERFVAFNTELYRLAEDLVAWEEHHERGGSRSGKTTASSCVKHCSSTSRTEIRPLSPGMLSHCITTHRPHSDLRRYWRQPLSSR